MLTIVSKTEPSALKGNLMRIAAVIIALAASAIVMAFMGYNPFVIYGKIIEGSLMSAYRLTETINKTIPLTVLALGVAVAFRMKFWNIGAEGQMMMGAYGAALIGFQFYYLPKPLLLILMFLVGALFGGLWALIPALLKTKFSTSETLVTLMLNYIAIKWVSYLQYGPWKDPKAVGFPKIANFSDNAILPKVFGVHIGWIITIFLAVLIYALFEKTKLGYEISVLGESETTARYAGMSVAKITITAVLISGGLCGCAGMMQASAIETSLSDQLSNGIGFTAVIVTWLAKLNPITVIIVSFLFSMLMQGGNYIQSAMKIPSTMSAILQGIIIFFVLGCEFFVRYKFVYKKKTNGKENA